MDKLKMRTVLDYEFRQVAKAAGAVRNINKVFGKGSTNKATVGRWFSKFTKRNFNLNNEPRGKPEPKVNNEELRPIANCCWISSDIQGIQANNIAAPICNR